VRCALLDLDGTLVDSNYHHALSWFRAIRGEGLIAPVWRIHRHIGMGGDQLVPRLLGDEVESAHGDALRAAWRRHYDGTLPEVAPCPGAHDLLLALRERGVAVVFASSAPKEHLARYVEILDADGLYDAATTADDVERTKPAPNVVHVALDGRDPGEALMIGDSPYDCEAAAGAGVDTVCVLTGGYSRAELEAAGAAAVYEDLGELTANILVGPR
jgi:HAD superfamily hydrolase (TIGR01509 family)